MMPDSPRKRGRPKSVFTESTAPTMQALDRALGVLGALAAVERATLTDLAQSVDVPTPTTHRILITLQKHGYAAFDDTSQLWMVGIEAYRTGAAYLKRTTLTEVARPIMRLLMEETGETANLAVPDRAEVVFVGQVETTNPIRAYFNPGTRTPMHASGTGKAILAAMDDSRARKLLASVGLPAFTDRTLVDPAALIADLERTRARGWSYESEERFRGMSCIGAAIRDGRGEVVGGVSISGPSDRFTEARNATFGERVADAARQISLGIGNLE